MADTAEDNFRIEVWDSEEKTHLETICRSPDAVVSQAAWHAAIRRRPGMLLIHYNSPHVMEKIITPGEVKIPPQTIIDGSVHAGIDVALGDLREWHTLRGLVHEVLASCRSQTGRADPAIRQGWAAQQRREGAFLHELRQRRSGSAGDTQAAEKLSVWRQT